MRIMKFILACMVVGFIWVASSPVSDAQRRKIDCTKDDAHEIRENYYDTLEFLGTTLYSGYIETNDQDDAIVAGYIGNAFQWCRRYETETVNTRAQQLDEWGGRVFVILTVDERSAQLDSFATGGWISSYGAFDGPQVGLVLEIDPLVNGEPELGTYIISKTIDGQTNSVVMYGVQAYDLEVHIDGIASSYVLDAQLNPQDYVDCPRGSAFRYILDYDMRNVLEIQCNGVTARSNAVLRNTGEIPEDLPESINPGGDFFSYCTTSNGILVMGTNNGVGYELFAVSNAHIANAVQVAGDLGQNIQLGEAEGVSLWALEDGENLQFSKPDGYEFIFNKYRCGDLFPDGAPISIVTTVDLPPDEIIIQTVPQAVAPQPTPVPSTRLPVYRPSALNLNDDGTYTIRAGDNLNTIAAKLGVNVDVLAEYNNIADKRLIQVGQVLEIPKDE